MTRLARPLPLLALSTLGVLAYACSDDAPSSTLLPATPCETTFVGLCGTACAQDADCPSGLHCEADACTAACTPGGDECAAGLQCTADGRCASGGGDGGGDASTSGTFAGSGGASSSAGGAGGEGGACGAVTVAFEPTVPTVTLLIDRSSSMNVAFDNQNSRWEVVRDVLMDPQAGIVKQLEGQVRFSLALYTRVNGDPTCPNLIEVAPPALNNFNAIDAVYSVAGLGNGTPTGESLAAVVNDLASFAEPGPKLVVLASDGEPDTCANSSATDASRQLVVDTAAAAFADEQITTVIVAVGQGISDEHQQNVANAGLGLPTPAPFPCDPQAQPATCAPTYEPSTKQALIDDLTAIINGQRTCVFTLDGEVVDGKECEGTVLVNGTPVPCNDADGYQLNGPSEIEFLGSTCDTIIEDGSVTITAEFPCDSVVPIPR